MKKTSVIFEVTESKTKVAVICSTGVMKRFDITLTDIEKDFAKLLVKLKSEQMAKEIVKATDINTWEEV